MSLKKLHVPAIFITAIQAIENEIPAEKFGGWVQIFMSHKPQAYTKDTGSGTAASTKVESRILAMKKLEHMEFSSWFYKPHTTIALGISLALLFFISNRLSHDIENMKFW